MLLLDSSHNYPCTVPSDLTLETFFNKQDKFGETDQCVQGRWQASLKRKKGGMDFLPFNLVQTRAREIGGRNSSMYSTSRSARESVKSGMAEIKAMEMLTSMWGGFHGAVVQYSILFQSGSGITEYVGSSHQ